jgi:Ser/Thr protein kinase RdoA (MazF antagonist)
MMRLSTLWRVDRTVTADGRSPVAEQILARWRHEPGSARFFRSSANFVYTFRDGDERRFLRFADAGERRREVVEAEVALLRWLAPQGVPVAEPLPSRDGSFVETVRTRLGTFHAVVFTALEGDQSDIDELDAPRFRRWGAALGSLHASIAHCPLAGTLIRPSWQEQIDIARTFVPVDRPGLRREFDEVATALQALPVHEDTYGLIHGDLELDNLVWSADRIAMLDFDACARHWYAADIALALRDLDDGLDTSSGPLRDFLHGYAAHRPVDNALPERLPLFARTAKLLEYATLVRALDLPAADGYPDWLTSLVRKLEDRRAAYDAAHAT